jgi:hypothetical protein
MNKSSFYFASLIIVFVYGMVSERYKLFPSQELRFMINQARLVIGEVSGNNDWFYVDAPNREKVPVYKPDEVAKGLTLITGLSDDYQLNMKIINFKGEVHHQWLLDWYKIWPDATHIPKHLVPKGKPGTHIHGSKLLDNGDILFNFENLGLVRLDVCGNTVFKLAYPTHHSIHEADDGTFWIPGQIYHQTPLADYPNYKVPFKDDTVVQVSQDGEITTEISIMEILKKNNYEGLMYLSTIKSRDTSVTGDVYHLNDVEVFPSTMEEGVFKHGDIMVSLRNINTVFVFDPKTLKIRYLTAGKFVRQHDPDFIDGNTISVYDNNHIAPNSFEKNHSKIVVISALTDEMITYAGVQESHHFYSNIMGKHQWLDNGNLLILESMNGRVLEINKQKQLVWSYNNLIADEGVVGIMEGAYRLSKQFDETFIKTKLKQCQ